MELNENQAVVKYHDLILTVSRFATWYDSQCNEKITMPMERLFEIFAAVYRDNIPTVFVKNKVTTVNFKWKGVKYVLTHDLLLGDIVRSGRKLTKVDYPFDITAIAIALADPQKRKLQA